MMLLMEELKEYKMICHKCKQNIDDDSIYCDLCGQKVGDNNIVPETENKLVVNSADNILPRTFKEFADKHIFALCWFVLWRQTVISVPLIAILALIFIPIHLNRITFILMRLAGVILCVIVTDYVAKYAGRKIYGLAIKRFIGWTIFWRTMLITILPVMVIGMILAILIPFFARIAGGKVLAEIVFIVSFAATVPFFVYINGKVTDIAIRKYGTFANNTNQKYVADAN